MGTCAYCGSSSNKITREHVVSQTFLGLFHLGESGYANVYGRDTHNFLTTKDVCDVCNNGVLSQLDESFINTYRNFEQNTRITPGNEIEFSYDHGKMLRWLLKTFYNSERKNSYSHDNDFLSRYTEYILGNSSEEESFLSVELLSDHKDIPDSILVRDGIKKSQLKVGSIQCNPLSSRLWIKYFVSGNLAFYVFFPKFGKIPRNQYWRLGKKFGKELGTDSLHPLLPKTKYITLKASKRTIVDILGRSIEGEKSAIQRFIERGI